MNCMLMLKVQGAETICLHMNEADLTGQVLLHSSEILWNLLERGSREEVTAQLSSMECIMYVPRVFDEENDSPKIERSHMYYSPLCRFRVWRHIVIHKTILEFHAGTEFHPYVHVSSHGAS